MWSPIPVPGGTDDLEHGKVARGAAVDPLDPAALRVDLDRAFGCTHDDGGPGVAEQEPRDRDVKRVADRRQGFERWRGLVVLDLGEVADVQAAPLGDLREGQSALPAPPPDLRSDERTAGTSRPADHEVERLIMLGAAHRVILPSENRY